MHSRFEGKHGMIKVKENTNENVTRIYPLKVVPRCIVFKHMLLDTMTARLVYTRP
jgi:hypothetical protein